MRPELPPRYRISTDIAGIRTLTLLASCDDADSMCTTGFLTEYSWTDLPPAPAKKTPTADL